RHRASSPTSHVIGKAETVSFQKKGSTSGLGIFTLLRGWKFQRGARPDDGDVGDLELPAQFGVVLKVGYGPAGIYTAVAELAVSAVRAQVFSGALKQGLYRCWREARLLLQRKGRGAAHEGRGER